jgi:hypothetical protein
MRACWVVGVALLTGACKKEGKPEGAPVAAIGDAAPAAAPTGGDPSAASDAAIGVDPPIDAAVAAIAPLTPTLAVDQTGIQVVAIPDTAIGSGVVAQGLPAISADGKLVASLIPVDDGDRGLYGASVEIFDVTTRTTASTLKLIEPDEAWDHLKADDATPEMAQAYRDQVVAAVSAINDELAKHSWRPMIVGEPEEVLGDQTVALGDLTFTFESEGKHLLEAVRDGKTLMRFNADRQLRWPKEKDPDCRRKGASIATVMKDPEGSTVVVSFRILEGHHCGSYPRQTVVLELP